MTLEEMYNILIDFEIATEEEINLITCINGYNEENFKDVLYARTGYRNFDQLTEN